MKRLFLTFLLFVVIITLSQCGGSEPLSPKELVQERCTRCHTLAPIESSSKNRHEWESTVYRMIQKGAKLSDEEARRAIDYLVETYGTD